MECFPYTIEVDRVTKKEWIDIIKYFEDSSIFQVWSWGSVRWGEKNLSHVVLKENGKVIAAVQLWIIRVPLLGSGIAYVKWGPMWQPQADGRNLKNYRLIIEALKSEYVRKQGLLLRVMPNAIDGRAEELNSIMLEEGFERCRSIFPYRTLIVDLFPSLEELRKGLKKNWRYDLKQAERNRLTVIEGYNGDIFEVATEIYKEMRSRKKFPEFLKMPDLRKVQNDLPSDFKMKILICKSDEEPVAAVVVPIIGKTAVDFIAANSEKGLKLRSSFLLQWQMVQVLKERGCRWYDLGGIDPKNYPGPTYFKMGLSGEHGRDEMFYEYELCENLPSRLITRMGDYLRQIDREVKKRVSQVKNTAVRLNHQLK